MGGAPEALPNRFRRVYPMVKRALFLALFLPLIVEAFWDESEEQRKETKKGELIKAFTREFPKLDQIDPKQQKEAFENFKIPPIVLSDKLEKFPDKGIKSKIFDASKFELSAGQITAQYYNSLDKNTQHQVLKELILHYSDDPNKRQEFIDNLITQPTNKEYLLNPNVCVDAGVAVNPFYVGVIPVVEWINTAYQPSYFKPTMTDILVNKAALNEFNSLNQWGLWIEPYGLNTHFRRKHQDLHFDLFTMGVNVGAEVTLSERILLGFGATYSHSVLDWEKKKDDLRLNSIYVGPFLGYLFSSGYLSLTLMGVGNFYDITRDVQLSPKTARTHDQINQTSWDLLARLEGGFSYSPGGSFYFTPFAKVDYLHVFEQGCTETLEDDDPVELTIDSLYASFLSSKVGLKLTREWYNESYGYLIPNLSCSFLNFTPITQNEYHFEIEDCKSDAKVNTDSWNQYSIGAGFTFVHKKGVLISLDYELTLGSNSPVQVGSIRAELSW